MPNSIIFVDFSIYELIYWMFKEEFSVNEFIDVLFRRGKPKLRGEIVSNAFI